MNQRRRSPAVYRRRRLVAALLSVFLLALIIWGVRELWGFVTADDDAEPTSQTEETPEDGATTSPEPADPASPTETPEAGDSPEATESPQPAESPEPTEEPVPEGHCAPADISLTASTHQDSYAANEAPLLIMEIENTGSEECTIDVGTTEQDFTISDEARTVFTASQCGAAGESLEMEFEPGQSERAQLTWPRSDSAVDCAEPAELPGGEYQLTVSLSGISSNPYSFTLAGADQ